MSLSVSKSIIYSLYKDNSQQRIGYFKDWTFPSISEIASKTVSFLAEYSKKFHSDTKHAKNLAPLDSKQRFIFRLAHLEKQLRKGRVTNDLLFSQASILTTFAKCLNSIEQKAVEHTVALIKELKQGQYDPQAISEYLGWAMRLTLIALQGEPHLLNSKVKKLTQTVFSGSCQPKKRSSLGHSPSYFLQNPSTNTPVAILKKSHPLITTSFGKLLPKLEIKAPVWQHELIGFEQDQWFGFNFVPTTIAADGFVVEGEGKIVGSIQKYVTNSDAISGQFTIQGAHRFKAMPKSHLHRLAISGFSKGISAGHISNYLVKFDKDRLKFTKIVEIDLEEMLLPYNQLEKGIFIAPAGEIEEQISKLDSTSLTFSDDVKRLQNKKEMIRKSIILCRMCILGLPQNAEPFDRAALFVLTHPNLLPLMKQYHDMAAKKYPLINAQAWKAQWERIVEIQNFAIRELSKNVIEATPRDMYFSLFGGRHLWELAKERCIPDLITANNVVSDPYQHMIKDFGAPENIPLSKRLDEPRDASKKEEWDSMNFFRVLANLEPKTLTF